MSPEASTAFDADVVHRDGVAVVHLSGALDATAGPAMTTAHHQVLESDAAALVLNFSNVGYINSSGIALIVEVLARAKSDQRPVRSVGLSDHYRHVFEITRLSDFMTMYETEGAAVKGTTTVSRRAPTSNT